MFLYGTRPPGSDHEFSTHRPFGFLSTEKYFEAHFAPLFTSLITQPHAPTEQLTAKRAGDGFASTTTALRDANQRGTHSSLSPSASKTCSADGILPGGCAYSSIELYRFVICSRSTYSVSVHSNSDKWALVPCGGLTRPQSRTILNVMRCELFPAYPL